MEILCSTGAFVGRPNGGNYRLLTDWGHMLRCDGFELMVYPPWYADLRAVTAALTGCGLRFPVLHADKGIGDGISSMTDEEFGACLDTWRVNLELACAVGAEKVVTHIWGIPDSDREPERVFARVLRLRGIASSYGLDMLPENCCCKFSSPLSHFRTLLGMEPELGFTIDTRPAQFHRELEALCGAGELWHGAVRHLHISDYHGGERDWSALRPILPPGRGDVDFPAFFAHLKRVGYTGTVTLESPCMLPDRLDWETLNSYLDFIREGVR